MNKYVAVVFVLIQIQLGYSLICDVCSPLTDPKCQFSTKKECLPDPSPAYKLLLRRYKPACMTFTVENKHGQKFVGKNCVVDLSPAISPCEIANRTAIDVGGKVIVNTDCKLCYTDNCNAGPEADDLYKDDFVQELGNNNLDKK